jgi:hypothetical protein
VLSSTVPNGCGILTLRRPDNAGIASGCIVDGRGIIDTAMLPTTGQYSILLDPPAMNTGEALLRLTSVTDQTGTIAVNGPEVTGSVTQAGAVAAFSFAGTAGQKADARTRQTRSRNWQRASVR